MEELKKRELSMDELDKVSGGAGDNFDVNVLYDRLARAGLLPELSQMIRKQAVLKILEFCDSNGLPHDYFRANAVYDVLSNR